MGYLFINYLIKETISHFSSPSLSTLKAIFHQPYWPYPLFTCLWMLTTDFVLIQVNAGSDLPIFNCILPSLCESRLILLIYKKYGKPFVEIIPLPACYGMRIP